MHTYRAHTHTHTHTHMSILLPYYSKQGIKTPKFIFNRFSSLFQGNSFLKHNPYLKQTESIDDDVKIDSRVAFSPKSILYLAKTSLLFQDHKVCIKRAYLTIKAIPVHYRYKEAETTVCALQRCLPPSVKMFIPSLCRPTCTDNLSAFHKHRMPG